MFLLRNCDVLSRNPTRVAVQTDDAVVVVAALGAGGQRQEEGEDLERGKIYIYFFSVFTALQEKIKPMGKRFPIL